MNSIEDIIYTVIIIAIPTLFFIAVFWDPVKRFLIRKKELKEDSSNLAKHEPHPIRNLTDEEKNELLNKIRFSKTFSPAYIVGFIIVLTGTLGLFSKKVLQENPVVLFLLLLVPIIITIFIYYTQRTLAKKMQQDFNLPVSAVQGKAYKEEADSKQNRKYFVTVRGIMFDGSQLISSGDKLYDVVNQDQEVVIEYSPNSKYVWKVIKIN